MICTFVSAAPFNSGAPEIPCITAQSCRIRPFGITPRTRQSVSAVILNGYFCENPPTMIRSAATGAASVTGSGVLSMPAGSASVRIAQSARIDVLVAFSGLSARHAHGFDTPLPCNQAENVRLLLGGSDGLRG